MSPADFEKYVHLEIEKIKNQMCISFDSGVQAERARIKALIEIRMDHTIAEPLNRALYLLCLSLLKDIDADSEGER
jgi:hypothetical protein